MEAQPLTRHVNALPRGYTVRHFQSHDVQTWLAIQAAADRYNVITAELFNDAFASDAKMHRDRILIACDQQGTPVGTAAAWIGEGSRGDEIGRLHWVAVLPDHQGRGLGRALVQHAVTRLAELGHTAAYLTTGAARLTAIHVYDTCGFRARIATESDRVAWLAIARALAHVGRPLVHQGHER